MFSLLFCHFYICWSKVSLWNEPLESMQGLYFVHEIEQGKFWAVSQEDLMAEV